MLYFPIWDFLNSNTENIINVITGTYLHKTI